ncbi:MAG: polyprenyl synthetase family protein [Spirochaetaceae bacterium]|nr:MAG: polyprenyl synthetase family protein [Spirochaetaceae bacterium]
MNQFWEHYPAIRKDLERVHQIVLDNAVAGDGELSRIVREYAGRGGKMLRPAFVLLAAYVREGRFPAVNGTVTGHIPDKILKIAAAVEMLHMATLIHDDILDDATTRRGLPALHQQIGSKAAVLVGDLLFSRCFAMVADYATMESARRLAAGVAHICAGEIAQTQPSDPTRLSERTYIRRIAEKTALLFLISFHVGAVENGVNGRQLDSLRRVGYNVGIGFQITDDLLDLTSSERSIGKPVANDLRHGILTLPVIAALRFRPNDLAPLLAADLADNANLERIIAAVTDAGGVDYARARATAYTQRALSAARRLPSGEVRDAIVDVTNRLLTRTQ